MRGAGYGVVINIVVGVIGGILGGALLESARHRPADGWLLELAMAVVGAVLLLALVDLVRRARRPHAVTPARPACAILLAAARVAV